MLISCWVGGWEHPADEHPADVRMWHPAVGRLGMPDMEGLFRPVVFALYLLGMLFSSCFFC